MDKKHRWIDEFCGHLDRIVIGRAAKELAQEWRRPRLVEDIALVRLPTWMWAKPLINMGRKSRSEDGGTLLMPVRIEWDSGPLAIVTREGACVSWSAHGLGHNLSGKTQVLFGHPIQQTSDVPETLFVIPTRANAIPGLLNKLIVNGGNANWLAARMLYPHVRRAAERANVAISRELNPDLPGVLLDSEDLAVVINRLELGESGADSHVSRLVDRCTLPRAFDRVDPLKYVTRSVQRDVNEAIHVHLGDPREGARFRRFVASNEGDIDSLIAAFNQAYPRVQMGRARAAKSLLNQLDIFPSPVPYGLAPVKEAS